MRTRDEIISGVLITFSIIAFFVGVVTIIHAHGPLERDLETLMHETSRNLQLAESAAQAMQGQGDAVDALMAPRESASAFVGQVGPSLDATAKTLEDTAYTVDVTATTMRALAGATTLILPDEELLRNADALEGEATSLRKLAAASRVSQARAEALTTDLRRASKAYDGLEAELTKAGVSVGEYRRQLEGTRHAIEALDLPTATARRVSLQGGLYIVLSVILAVLTGIWMELKRGRDAVVV